eukprot:10855574-Alexandrium_andersonii.AAC.1
MPRTTQGGSAVSNVRFALRRAAASFEQRAFRNNLAKQLNKTVFESASLLRSRGRASGCSDP